jgi:hypothetical protein
VELFREGHLSSEDLQAQVFDTYERIIPDRVAAVRGQLHAGAGDVHVGDTVQVRRLGSMGFGHVTRVGAQHVWVMVNPMMTAKVKRSEVAKVDKVPGAQVLLAQQPGALAGAAEEPLPADYQELMSEVGVCGGVGWG